MRLTKHAPDVYITSSPPARQTCRIERRSIKTRSYLISLMQRFQRADRMTGSEGGKSAVEARERPRRLTEVIGLAFISIKMSQRRRSGTPVSEKREEENNRIEKRDSYL